MSEFNGVMGFNIHAAGVAGAPDGWSGLHRRIAALRPASCLIMDFDNRRALELKRLFPSMNVVLRMYYEQDHDWRAYSASGWMAAFGGQSADGIILQYLNEPTGYGTRSDMEALTQRCMEVAVMARSQGVRLALPNFAVGHPDTAHIESGVFDPLIRELARGFHVLGLHEYAQQSADEAHHITRYRAWFERAAQIGVARPRIIITETGRDVGGGYGDGWRAVMNDAQYAVLLRGIAQRYAPDGVSACIYGYGFNHDPKWHNFDVSAAPGLLDRLVAERVPLSGSPSSPPPPPVQTGAGYIQTPGAWVNVRSAPVIAANNVIGRAFDNQPVRVIRDAGDWIELEVVTITRGFVSKQNGRVRITEQTE